MLTSSFPGGNPNPEFTIAARTRSRASLSARSGRPMIAKFGVPGDASASIRTMTASIPAMTDE